MNYIGVPQTAKQLAERARIKQQYEDTIALFIYFLSDKQHEEVLTYFDSLNIRIAYEPSRQNFRPTMWRTGGGDIISTREQLPLPPHKNAMEYATRQEAERAGILLAIQDLARKQVGPYCVFVPRY